MTILNPSRLRSSWHWLFLATLAAVLTFVPSVGAQLDGTEQDAPVDELDDSLGFGYVAETGAVAIAPNTGYVYCPSADSGPLLAAHPDYLAQALEEIGATSNADGTWVTSDGVVRPQIATALIGQDGVDNSANLSVVPLDRVLLARAWWPNCLRLRFGYRCAGCYRCPQGCYPLHWARACSVRYTGTQRFKLCQYTGRPWDICFERTRYRCTATAYNCTNCTGNALWSQSWVGWSCFTGGC
ncbi:MAG: hypothetical protein AAGC60_25630 [Acidobacteriota bacterium]